MRAAIVLTACIALGSLIGVLAALSIRDLMADNASSCVVERINATSSRTSCD